MQQASLRKRKRVFDEKVDRLYKEFCDLLDAYSDQRQVQAALARIEAELGENQAYNVQMYNEECSLNKEAADEAQARLNRFNCNKANYVFDTEVNIQLEELRADCIGLDAQLKEKEESIR